MIKKIVITGANRGIGLGLTNAFLTNNHKVIATTRNLNKSPDLLRLRENFGETLDVVTLDVTNEHSISNFSKCISFESIDILVNNAGFMEKKNPKFDSLDFSELSKTIEINTFGPMKITQVLINKLLRSKNSKNVLITSKMGSITENYGGGYYSYRISKTAINMFCRSISIDYPTITSMVLHPGWVKTDMGGPNAIISVRESSTGLIKVILEATKSSSGKFMDFKGNELPW